MKINQGYIYVSLASIFWASTAAVSKLLLAHLDNLQVLFFSTLFASLSLLIISMVQGKFEVFKTYSFKDYAIFTMMGFIGVFLYRFFLQAAFMLMPVQEAFIVNYTWPIMVVIFAWIILKEKMNLKKVIGLLLSFIGVVVVTTKGNFSVLNFSIGGVLFALAGAVVYGFYSVLGKLQTYEKFTSTTFFYIFSFIFSNTACIIPIRN
jgi:drug/metabolite transporter (DMT)-like permease